MMKTIHCWLSALGTLAVLGCGAPKGSEPLEGSSIYPDGLDASIERLAYVDDPNLTAPVPLTLFDVAEQVAPDVRSMSGHGLTARAMLPYLDLVPEVDEELATVTAYVAALRARAQAAELLGVDLAPEGIPELTLLLRTAASFDPRYQHQTRTVVLPATEQSTVYGRYRNAAFSSDIVRHEVGHDVQALIKATTILTDGSQAHGSGAGEGVSDVLAFVGRVSEPQIVARALGQTGGQLTQRSALSETGETMRGEEMSLRSLLSDRVYKAGTGAHGTGEIIAAAMYDLFLSLGDVTTRDGEGLTARAARAARLFLNALKFSPDAGGVSPREYARGVLLAAFALGEEQLAPRLKDILVRRGLSSREELDQTEVELRQWQTIHVGVAGLSDEEAWSAVGAKLNIPEIATVRRVHRDALGITRLIAYQPLPLPEDPDERAELLALLEEKGAVVGAEVYGSIGAFTVVLDAQGRVSGVFSALAGP